MLIPSSTYRVQLNKDFGFADLEKIIDYLHELGITTIYASPITTAMPGSSHGYDVIDPHSINPEIGNIEDLTRIARKLKERGMSWVQDIVPNHMAFSTGNLRLMDVLERGPSSEFYHYFDINWNHPDPTLKGKLMVPILESDLDTCIEEGKIKISFTEEDGFTIDYQGIKLPYSACAYNFLTETCRLKNPEFSTELATARSHAWKTSGYNDWIEAKVNSMASFTENPSVLNECLALINEDKERLKHILERQYFTLTCWKETNEKINYRRFFTVNDLICLSMENEETFYDYHSFILDLYKEGLIQGLRIDHIDGLNNPGQYLSRLRKLFGSDCYIIVEKILELKERIPVHWPLQGTSGYEFLSCVSQVLTDSSGASSILNYYRKLVPQFSNYHEVVFNNKKLILKNYMQGELENILNFLYELEIIPTHTDRKGMREAIALFMICLPVYRLYPEKFPLTDLELSTINETFDKAMVHDPSLKNELHLLRNLFEEKQSDKSGSRKKLIFIRRLMQFTGPLTAKGVEDTSFYVYNPLISHNEVGDSPAQLGTNIEDFHKYMKVRQIKIPHSMNCTATHDTKRGEDARMRINVLSEIPEEWNAQVSKWIKLNTPLLKKVNGAHAPSINEQFFLYQSLVGGFPFDHHATPEYRERLKNYFIKVLREGKINSNWNESNIKYENACCEFIDSILDPKHSFLSDFKPLLEKIISYASVYTLNQALIKLTAPGLPDIYQGCELWDLSYVDPDNRRAVDYETRQRLLARILTNDTAEEKEILSGASRHRLDFLSQHRNEGLEKLYITYHALNARKISGELFIAGEYIPIFANKRSSIIAFARTYKNEWFISICACGIAKERKWAEIELILPENAPGSYLNLMTGKTITATRGKLRLAELNIDRMPGLLKGI